MPYNLSKTASDYIGKLLNGGKGPLNRDVFEKQPAKSDKDKKKPPKGGGKKYPSLVQQTLKKAGITAKEWVDSNAEQFKRNPALKTAAVLSGIGGFAPGAVGAGLTGTEAYLNAKLNGKTNYEASRDAAINTAATLGMGKLANVGGKALAKTKIGQEAIKAGEDILNRLTPKKLAPQYAYTPNSTMGRAQQAIKGEGTFNNYVPSSLDRAVAQGTNPKRITDISSRGKKVLKEFNPESKQYDKLISDNPAEVDYLRQKEVIDELNKAGLLPDDTLLNPETGHLTGEGWLRPEAKNVAPYLYEPDIHVHGSPVAIKPGESLREDLRMKQDGPHISGGDWGLGGYTVFKGDIDPETGGLVEDLVTPAYRGYKPVGYDNIIEAPAEKYYINPEKELFNHPEEIQEAYRSMLSKQGHNNEVIRNIIDDGTTTGQLNEFLNIPFKDQNTFLNRAYGIPGIKERYPYAQVVTGDEGVNTFVHGAEEVLNPIFDAYVNGLKSGSYKIGKDGVIKNSFGMNVLKPGEEGYDDILRAVGGTIKK